MFYKQGLGDTPLPEINFDLLRNSKIVEGKLVEKTQEEMLLKPYKSVKFKVSDKIKKHFKNIDLE